MLLTTKRGISHWLLLLESLAQVTKLLGLVSTVCNSAPRRAAQPIIAKINKFAPLISLLI